MHLTTETIQHGKFIYIETRPGEIIEAETTTTEKDNVKKKMKQSILRSSGVMDVRQKF